MIAAPVHSPFTASRWWEIAALLFVGFFLTGCAGGAPPTSSPTIAWQPEPAAVTATPPAATPSPRVAAPTPVLDVAAPTPGEAAPTSAATPTAPPAGPLRLVFPTPGPAPVSAWRPPLYPAPWAPTLFDHFYFTRPIAADEVNWPVADYRYGGVFFENVVHTGVDIPAEKGTPVLAAGAGKVVWAGFGVYSGATNPNDPYGLAVVLRHDFGYGGEDLFTVYGHLDRVDVAEGQHVESGETLGLVGETGQVTGPHLHFEVRLGENSYFTTRNPELWITPPQGWGILAARVMTTQGELVQGQEFVVESLESGQRWYVNTYTNGPAQPDPYYRENLVLGDLPAGWYEVRLAYVGTRYETLVEIFPGQVSFFKFQGRQGFSVGPPPTPGADFAPTAFP